MLPFFIDIITGGTGGGGGGGGGGEGEVVVPAANDELGDSFSSPPSECLR